GDCSTNWNADVVRSNRLNSGSVTRKLATEPTSATQRTVRAWSSRPRASSTAPKKIGVQMARLRSPIVVLLLAQPGPDRRPGDEVRHQTDDSQQHGERIVIDVAGLNP